MCEYMKETQKVEGGRDPVRYRYDCERCETTACKGCASACLRISLPNPPWERAVEVAHVRLDAGDVLGAKAVLHPNNILTT